MEEDKFTHLGGLRKGSKRSKAGVGLRRLMFLGWETRGVRARDAILEMASALLQAGTASRENPPVIIIAGIEFKLD